MKNYKIYIRNKSIENRKEIFKKILKRKELSIGEIADKLDVRRETVSRWVSFFEMEGFLKTRFNGLKKLVSLA